MGFKLNLTKDEITAAQGGGFPVLPKGTYGAVIYSCKQEISKSSQQPMFTIDYKLTDGPVPVGKRRIRAWYSLTPKALFKVIELNKAVEFPYPNKDTVGEFEFAEPDEYNSIPVLVKIEVEDYASVSTETDVEQGVLNSETGEPVTAEEEPVTKQRNVVARVLKYDEDKITTADDLAADEQDDEGKFTL
jgi:hypothetical protein